MVNKSVTNTYHLSYVTTHELNSFLGDHSKKTELYKMRDFTSFKLSNDISWATYNDEQRCEYAGEAKLHGTLKSEAVQFLIKNQLPTSTAYVNLIGLTAGRKDLISICVREIGSLRCLTFAHYPDCAP